MKREEEDEEEDQPLKRRLSVNDIDQFKDITRDEIWEFQEMLLVEHWDYGMPVPWKEIWNLKTWLFEFEYIKNLFPRVKD